MQVLNSYLTGVYSHKNTAPMHDLKTNFVSILSIVNTTLCDQLNTQSNLQSHSRSPRLPDAHIICLALLQEALSIDSERWIWSKLQTDYQADFPDLPHLTIYNRHRKCPARWIEQLQLARRWARYLCSDEDTFIVGSIPVSVAHVAREYSTCVYREHFKSAPDKGYSAKFDQFYIDNKLHLVVSLDWVYHYIDLTKASVHDVHYLKDIETRGLRNCLLLADKGYLSNSQQIDLFYRAGIELQTPMRSNQNDYRRWPNVFKSAHRRVETVFLQLCDYIMLKRNYTKKFAGLCTQIISKVSQSYFCRYTNWLNDKPINMIKYALALRLIGKRVNLI